jgi:hypothetical protein
MSKQGIGSHTAPYRGHSDDWITPPEIVTALGDFDLDPCACNPQPFETARLMIQPPDDGLSRPWMGRVWLNPPYGPDTAKWLQRLSQHDDGIALIFARTETKMFFEWVWSKANSLLFIEGRLYFYRPDGVQAAHNSGGPSVLIAYGYYNGLRLKNSGIPGKYVSLT